MLIESISAESRWRRGLGDRSWSAWNL